jgi:hypothetical protein
MYVVYFFVGVVMDLLSRYSTYSSSPFFVLGIFEIGSCELFV